ncbi:MAG: SH3 domain-containing protein [Chloroflexi bacterium]|nr:SH3 domain-containing protein [Chloroflexota bacterium]
MDNRTPTPLAGQMSPQMQWGIIGAVIIGLTCLICTGVMAIYLLFSGDSNKDNTQSVNNPTPFIFPTQSTPQTFPTAQPTQTLRPSATPFSSGGNNNNPPPVVQPTFPSNAGPAAYVSGTNTLNVRSGPGTEFAIVQTIGLDQLVGLVGRNNASTWLQIRLVSGTVGWASTTYLRANVALASLPVTEAPPAQPLLTANPSTIAKDTQVALVGTGYPASTQVNVYIGLNAATIFTNVYASTFTDANGNFSTSFKMPAQWPNGQNIGSGPMVISVKTAANVGALTTVTFTASQTYTPVVVISPNTGPSGTNITVSGSGYPPSVSVSVRLAITSTDFLTTPYVTAVTSTSGTFATSFIMPSKWPDNSTITQTNLQVVALVDGTSYVDSEAFTYQPAVSTAVITINPTSASASTDISVSGSNFPANTTVEIRLGLPSAGYISSPYLTVSTNSSGAFTTPFTIPTQWTNGTPITDTALQVVVTVASNPSISAVTPFTFVP